MYCALASCGAVYCNRSCLWVCDSGRAVSEPYSQRAQCLCLCERFLNCSLLVMFYVSRLLWLWFMIVCETHEKLFIANSNDVGLYRKAVDNWNATRNTVIYGERVKRMSWPTRNVRKPWQWCILMRILVSLRRPTWTIEGPKLASSCA